MAKGKFPQNRNKEFLEMFDKHVFVHLTPIWVCLCIMTPIYDKICLNKLASLIFFVATWRKKNATKEKSCLSVFDALYLSSLNRI